MFGCCAVLLQLFQTGPTRPVPHQNTWFHRPYKMTAIRCGFCFLLLYVPPRCGKVWLKNTLSGSARSLKSHAAYPTVTETGTVMKHANFRIFYRTYDFSRRYAVINVIDQKAIAKPHTVTEEHVASPLILVHLVHIYMTLVYKNSSSTQRPHSRRYPTCRNKTHICFAEWKFDQDIIHQRLNQWELVNT